METKEKKFSVKDIEFDIKYTLKKHESNFGSRYFPSISSVEYKGVDLKDLLDNSFLDEIRVSIYKENNNI
jgi:hypothetical protein